MPSRRSAPLLIGLGILIAQFAWLSASAEGSFFKDRQSAAGSQRPAAPQKLATPASPAPLPTPAPAPTASTSASTGSDTEGQTARVPDTPPSQPVPQQARGSGPDTPPPVTSRPQPSPQEPPRSADVSGAVTEVLSTDTFVVANGRIVSQTFAMCAAQCAC